MSIIYLCVIINLPYIACIEENNWFFHTPSGSGMGLFLALALPVDITNRNVYLSYNFEVNYSLPDNETTIEYPPVIKEQNSIKRSFVYQLIEEKINKIGYNGKYCLLKLICEYSHSYLGHNGLISDVLHVILMPSASVSEHLGEEFTTAERAADCSTYKCPSEILSFIL